jgi:23S rRNA-/tRNA-specific pseudouridylate synthase
MGSGLDPHTSVDKMLSIYLYNEEEGYLVHRLDRKTSGLMVLAKTKEMAKYLGQVFMERQA